MAAREETPFDHSMNFPADILFDNAEGDWQAYVSACDRVNAALEGRAEILSSKRACALAYLGRRAQRQGAVYSKSRPRVLTSQAIASLEAANRTQRFKRYPWLERLLTLLAEIESMQDEIFLQGNILPFSRPTK
jgi:hypothetical protein